MQKALNDNAANLFRNRGDQGEYALLSLLPIENRDERFHYHTGKIFVLKSGIIKGCFFCSRESIKNGGSKVKSVIGGSYIKQRVIASEKYCHGGRELFSFGIIVGVNVMGDFTYHTVQHLCTVSMSSVWRTKRTDMSSVPGCCRTTRQYRIISWMRSFTL